MILHRTRDSLEKSKGAVIKECKYEQSVSEFGWSSGVKFYELNFSKIPICYVSFEGVKP